MKTKGTKIILNDKDNSSQEFFDRVLKKFKKRIKKFGIIKEVRDRMYYQKPSTKKRLKRMANKRRRKKK